MFKGLHYIQKGVIGVALCVTLPFYALAQSASAQTSDEDTLVQNCVQHVQKEWHFGAGHSNILDTYLSPIEHCGPALSLLHRTERLAHWGKGKITVQGFYSGNLGLLKSVADQGKAFDGNLTAAAAWHYNFHTPSRTRLAIGGMAETELGFTYLTRGGNNPAQGRCGVNIGLSLIGEQPFHVRGKEWNVMAQLDIPLIGARFTPNYGQSYYEIFSLGNYDRNVRLTHPVNAPSARLLTRIYIPISGAKISLGYLGDIRQHKLNHLKRHSWNHYFTIGYVRHFILLR